jgi:hypothetical protein
LQVAEYPSQVLLLTLAVAVLEVLTIGEFLLDVQEVQDFRMVAQVQQEVVRLQLLLRQVTVVMEFLVVSLVIQTQVALKLTEVVMVAQG